MSIQNSQSTPPHYPLVPISSFTNKNNFKGICSPSGILATSYVVLLSPEILFNKAILKVLLLLLLSHFSRV